jgi:hypothetical protein
MLTRLYLYGRISSTLLKIITLAFLSLFLLSYQFQNVASHTPFPTQTVTQWSPYLEWSVPNANYSGNPFDVIATVTFVHESGQESRTTHMFYAGDNTWKFRFTGTQLGQWHFTSSSSDPDLHGHSGTVVVTTSGVNEPGFISSAGDKWIRTGTGRAFVPQFVMISGPQDYYQNTARIQAEINLFFNQHGFNGVHIPVLCRWYDIDENRCTRVAQLHPDPSPDLQTFAALETVINEVYAAGGVVHIWVWGDSDRRQNAHDLPGGINGHVDQRLQRYIAARLGPLPGWTIGYGFDLWEWATGDELTQWHDNMSDYFGWHHELGARSSKNQLNQLSEAMDYSSYEQHRPDYAKYVETIEARPYKPSFSEDRFRIRNEGRPKDYSMEDTRRGLWHSTMAGGVANIWGNLLGASGANDGLETSAPYPNPEQIKTYSLFFANRFWGDMERCNGLTNGVCLKRPGNAHYLFYREGTSTITMNLSGMNGAQTAVAVDTKQTYQEITIGQLTPGQHTWQAPYISDWAISVGSFPHTPLPIPPNYTDFLYLPLITR